MDFTGITGFDWDDHNRLKSVVKHQVAVSEAEQMFFNVPLVVAHDVNHSLQESRYYCLGATDVARRLFAVFTIRNQLIRIISVRDMHKKEKYMKRIKRKTIPEFASEKQEREFWNTADSAEYIDWRSAKTEQFPNLKPSTESISLRLPKALLENLKILANKQDVPYQSLLKIILARGVREEMVKYSGTK